MRRLTAVFSTYMLLCGLNMNSMAAVSNLNTNGAPVPLAEIHESAAGGSRSIYTELGFAWGALDPTGVMVEHRLDWPCLGLSDIGKAVTHSNETSPEFTYYASMLTSATDDYLILLDLYCPGLQEHGGHGEAESVWLDKLVQTPTVDFYGYEITEIALTLNALTFDSPGSNPNKDGIWTDHSYDVTYTIYGIPEPATLLLLGLATPALRRKDLSRKRPCGRIDTNSGRLLLNQPA